MDRAGPPSLDAPGPDATADLLIGRRSVDRFLAEPPPRKVIERALDTARWAPNHGITEPWHFYLPGVETIAGIVALNAQLVAASKGEEAGRMKARKWSAVPGWFAMTCRKSDDALLQREDYAACCCAAQNIMLYLWSCGVGSKWTTGQVTREAEFCELLGVNSAAEEVVGLFWYGYPAGEPTSLRREAEGFITVLP